MNIGQSLSSIKKGDMKVSPEAFDMDNRSPWYTQGGLLRKPTDKELVKELRKTMELAMSNGWYNDAIFFADKILALSIHDSDQYVKAIYDLAHG